MKTKENTIPLPQSSTPPKEYWFGQLKSICHDACHTRHACTEGFRQMLESDNVEQMMATWRANWDDLVRSKYADILRQRLPQLYPSIKAEMNAAGVYLNECPENAQKYVRVIVTDCTAPVHIYGHAEAYVLGTATVTAHDNAQVYNYSAADAYIILLDDSFGQAWAGRITAMGRSSVHCCCQCTLNGSVICITAGGTVDVLRFRYITASGDAVVRCAPHRNIHLLGNARLEDPSV